MVNFRNEGCIDVLCQVDSKEDNVVLMGKEVTGSCKRSLWSDRRKNGGYKDDCRILLNHERILVCIKGTPRGVKTQE